MATLLLLTNDMHASAEILPALELLPHQVKVAQAEATALLDAPAADVILLDARRDLVGARSLCRLIETTGKEAPLLVIASEGGLAALSSDWGFDDLLLATAGPAEVDVRLRLAMSPSVATNVDPVIQTGNILIDEAGYSAKLNGVQLDLTYTEFELLKYLAQHPGRVFSRQQLLSDVWGYDYYGGTRTVDVHVRRLRAKLGPEYESVIGTVRNVGYRFVTPVDDANRVPSVRRDAGLRRSVRATSSGGGRRGWARATIRRMCAGRVPGGPLGRRNCTPASTCAARISSRVRASSTAAVAVQPASALPPCTASRPTRAAAYDTRCAIQDNRASACRSCEPLTAPGGHRPPPDRRPGSRRSRASAPPPPAR